MISGKELPGSGIHRLMRCHSFSAVLEKCNLRPPHCSGSRDNVLEESWAASYPTISPTDYDYCCSFPCAWRWLDGPPATTLWVLFKWSPRQGASWLVSTRPYLWRMKSLWPMMQPWKKQNSITALLCLHTSVSICCFYSVRTTKKNYVTDVRKSKKKSERYTFNPVIWMNIISFKLY